MGRVDRSDIDHWHKHGYVVVEDVCSPDEVAAALDNLHDYMPTWDEYRQRPHCYGPVVGNGVVRHPFPFVGDPLNNLTFHTYLLEFMETVFGTKDLALSHSGVFGKYAAMGDFEQELHVDFGNNTLAYPKDDLSVFDLPVIMYYSDVTIDLGPTYVVSQADSGTGLLEPRRRSRRDYPALYERETPVTVTAGSAFIYSMRTFHRGSAMSATEGVRYSHHLAYHSDGPRWLGSHNYQRAGGSPEMDHFMTAASPRQRELVGFPPVGHSYWDAETLAGVAARYPGIDMGPYKEAIATSR